MRAAVYLDRDGVLNQLVRDPVSGNPESPLAPDDVALLPWAAEGARRLRRSGFLLVGVSNQPAAAKGRVTVERLAEVHDRVIALLAFEGVRFDDFRICLHHPDGIIPSLTGSCDCRKPAPGMLLASAAALHIDLGRSWMIGDTDSDVAAGRAAGCRTVLLLNPGSGHKRSGRSAPDLSAGDLRDAAAQLVCLAEG